MAGTFYERGHETGIRLIRKVHERWRHAPGAESSTRKLPEVGTLVNRARYRRGKRTAVTMEARRQTRPKVVAHRKLVMA